MPEGFAIDADLDDESEKSKDDEEDYSDLDTDLIEVSDKEEKLLPDADLKWEEDEEKEDTSPYQGGAPDESA